MPLEVFATGLKTKKEVGGADGIRTHDLLDAIEARSQLRHGPTEGVPKFITAGERQSCVFLSGFSKPYHFHSEMLWLRRRGFEEKE